MNLRRFDSNDVMFFIFILIIGIAMIPIVVVMWMAMFHTLGFWCK